MSHLFKMMRALNPLNHVFQVLLLMLLLTTTVAGSVTQTSQLELPKGDYQFAEFRDRIVALDVDEGVLYESDASLTALTARYVLSPETWTGGKLFRSSDALVISSDAELMLHVSRDLVEWETVSVPAQVTDFLEHGSTFYIGTPDGLFRKDQLAVGSWEAVPGIGGEQVRGYGDMVVALDWNASRTKATAYVLEDGNWTEHPLDEDSTSVTTDLSYYDGQWFRTHAGLREFYSRSESLDPKNYLSVDLLTMDFLQILEGSDFRVFTNAALLLDLRLYWQLPLGGTLPYSTIITGGGAMTGYGPKVGEESQFLEAILEIGDVVYYLYASSPITDSEHALVGIPRKVIDDYLPEWGVAEWGSDGDLYARGLCRISRIEGDWFHSENHGWLYRYGNGWYYDTHLGAIYYDPKSAPAYSSFIYSLGEEQWYRYLEGTNAPRWMWSYGSGEWVSVPRSFE